MDKDVYVWRIWDPDRKEFIRSGRGMYAKNGRSVWSGKGGAKTASLNLPLEQWKRIEIKRFKLVEAPE